MVTGNFREVARILDAERPALVVLDLVLPGSDGVGLLAEVPGLAELPVIFISAYGRDETVALDAGAVCAYDDLARTVWKRRERVDPKLVRAFVRRLRAKLGESAGRPAYVLTERGVGYRMPAAGRL